jgi:TPR repeat protein
MKTVWTHPGTWLRRKLRGMAKLSIACLAIALFSITGEAQATLPHKPARVATPPAAQVAAAESGDAAAGLKLANGFYNGQYGRRDFASAVKWYTRSAQAGNNEAKAHLGLCYLFGRGVAADPVQGAAMINEAAASNDRAALRIAGVMYQYGQGVPKDEAKAASLFTSAVAQGDVNSLDRLGTLYFFGRGVPRDRAKAVQLFKQGARAGDSWAKLHLARLYQRGKGTPRQPQYALSLLLESAGQGNRAAQYATGRAYLLGIGATRNRKTAVYYYRLSASHGYTPAQRVLGILNERKGTERNLVNAYAWYSLAARRGDKVAGQKMSELRGKLTTEDVSAAAVLAAKFNTMIEQE